MRSKFSQTIILPQKEAGLKEVDEWMPFIDPFDAEVKILVCDQCSTAVDDDNSELLSKVKGKETQLFNLIY